MTAPSSTTHPSPITTLLIVTPDPTTHFFPRSTLESSAV